MISPFLLDQIFQTQICYDSYDQIHILDESQQLIDSNFKSHNSSIRKPQKLKRRNYKKNIIGHIIKKSIREFLNLAYYQRINSICQKYNQKISQCMSYYSKQIQKITGPSHLQSIIVPQNKQQVRLKSVFVQFLEWYLKQRYLRYLLSQGRMQNKQIYIDYKNKKLLKLIQNLKIKAQKVEHQFIRILQPSDFMI